MQAAFPCRGLLIFHPVQFLLSRCNKSFANLKLNLSTRVIALSVALLSGLYTLLVSSAFEPFHCVIRSGDVLVLANDPCVVCYQTDWYNQLPYVAIFSLLYVVIVPAVLLVCLYRNKAQLNSPEVRQRYGALYAYYRGDCYWWEILLMLKRALFSLIWNA